MFRGLKDGGFAPRKQVKLGWVLARNANLLSPLAKLTEMVVRGDWKQGLVAAAD